MHDETSLSAEAPVVETEEVFTDSLADWVIAFDPTPYLSPGLQDAWISLQAYPLLFALVLVALGYGLGRLAKSVIHKVLHWMAESKYSEVDQQIAHFLTQPVLQTTVTFALVIALATLDFPGAIEHTLVKICFTVLLFLWGRAWFRATRVILQALEAERDRFHLFQPRTIPLYEMGIKLALLGLFVYFFFIVWGINPTAWFASAGIIGIAVGFAARDTLANLISGVSIVADAPYKIGDFIVLDTGERGLVTSLGIRSTRLLTRDDVEVSIPNAIIGTAKIVNESGGPYIRHRIRIPIGVSYASDIDKVIDVLKSIARDEDNVVDEPAPRVRIRGFGDNAINLELLCWIRRPAERGIVVHRLNRDIIHRFREEQIEIPFPQRDVHVKEVHNGPAEPPQND
jgi:small-conductance mechanosensitive channel